MPKTCHIYFSPFLLSAGIFYAASNLLLSSGHPSSRGYGYVLCAVTLLDSHRDGFATDAQKVVVQKPIPLTLRACCCAACAVGGSCFQLMTERVKLSSCLDGALELLHFPLSTPSVSIYVAAVWELFHPDFPSCGPTKTHCFGQSFHCHLYTAQLKVRASLWCLKYPNPLNGGETSLLS